MEFLARNFDMWTVRDDDDDSFYYDCHFLHHYLQICLSDFRLVSAAVVVSLSPLLVASLA